MPPSTRSDRKVHLEMRPLDSTADWIAYGYWAVAEGGGVTAETTVYQDWDGPLQMPGTREREDMTLRRAFGRHANEALSVLDRMVGSTEVRITSVNTDSAGNVRPSDERLTYVGVLTGAKQSDLEKGSSEMNELELAAAVQPGLA